MISTEMTKGILGRVKWDLIEEWCKEAEKLYRNGSIEDRKTFVVGAINALIDIPILPEGLEAIFFGWVVDLVVQGLDRVLGKNWFGPEEPPVSPTA